MQLLQLLVLVHLVPYLCGCGSLWDEAGQDLPTMKDVSFCLVELLASDWLKKSARGQMQMSVGNGMSVGAISSVGGYE
jgi:hypothetical protein